MKLQNGLTLIEVAVVLTIVGLVVGSLLIPLTTQIDVANIQRTNMNLEKIKEALVNYATLYNRLPCPASDENSGREDPSLCQKACNGGKDDTGFCKQGTPSEEGLLPWASLGIGQYDAWGNHLKYRVDINYVNGITNELLELVASNYSNNIVIQDNGGTSEAVAVIVSDGKNGSQVSAALSELLIPSALAAPTCEPNQVCYEQGDYVHNTFVVESLSNMELLHRLVSAGNLPSNTTAILTPLFYDIQERETDIPSQGTYQSSGLSQNQALGMGGGNPNTASTPTPTTVEKWYSNQ
jgi:prepilin-type N-terminal cleavage/methylation domain-containing protein